MSTLRRDLVNTLVGSLMGPAGGHLEVLPRERDPREEYITGVLAPYVSPDHERTWRDVEAEADVIVDGGSEGDETDDDDISTPPSFSPSLDPRVQPHSMGLTFVAEPCDDRTIHVGATWARYGQRDDGMWERSPFHAVIHLDPRKTTDRIPCEGNVSLRYWSRPVPSHPHARRISIFLVNDAPPEATDRPPATGLLVFQPQIRVVLDEPMTLQNILSTDAEGDGESGFEDQSLALLYHERPVLARGHMCAATWREIDPEAGDSAILQPLDLESLPVDQRAPFRSPHLRTVYLPMVPVHAPEMSWDDSNGTSPCLDPGELSRMYAPDALESALRPLQRGYEQWIKKNREELPKLPASLTATAERHLETCMALASRIGAGIDLLTSNKEIRLAFCFSNQAMVVQSEWKKAPPLRWRPFQLAFILLSLRGVAEPASDDREVCDLLWFPTGGGKTEAYLGLTALTLAMRRLRSPRDARGHRTGSGVAVISRYTLRLLTIQQFRRALRVILACEMLRIKKSGASHGWRPEGCGIQDDWLWGTHRFSAGLWVGGGVTPNHLESIGFPTVPGAIELLREEKFGHGEPAQVPRCPACDSWLAIPQPRHAAQERPVFSPGEKVRLHLAVFIDGTLPPLSVSRMSTAQVQLESFHFEPLPSGSHLLQIDFVSSGDGVSAREIDAWWKHVERLLPGMSRVESARASRPGYFIREYSTGRGTPKAFDFEIFCPNRECPTAAEWREGVPVPLADNAQGWQDAHPCFRSSRDASGSVRVPIPGITVDAQIYGRPPCMVIATVDKFARLAFEPRAASLFGLVEYYHARTGYYRSGAPAGDVKPGDNHPPVGKLSTPVGPFPPPDLIIQDELHLIDGPLGSMVGLYECAIDQLCRTSERPLGPKYVASTATVREAAAQVEALFARRLVQFPAPGLRSTDNFFARINVERFDEEGRAGRLYVGVCAPGKGGQTPTVRIWATLLQAVETARRTGVPGDLLDSFWTLVGYFNAVRELAAAQALYRQDIHQRIDLIAGTQARDLQETVELSSRADALRLPSLLTMLEGAYPEAVDAVLATSMFGTGVDVDRLGLMIVHGQPKTTSSYIQATGRVGRKRGGLVVAFLSASRPRDLDHYEFFTGYHRQLYRAVEPVTVCPFSPRARERALGPLCVTLLRQAREIEGAPVDTEWRRQQVKGPDFRTGAGRMAIASATAEVAALSDLLERRAKNQPSGRRPDAGIVRTETQSELDRWKKIAQTAGGLNGDLLYYEHAMAREPSHPVVLGDAQHERRQLAVAFENAPTSLRDVEATTGFWV